MSPPAVFVGDVGGVDPKLLDIESFRLEEDRSCAEDCFRMDFVGAPLGE